ncbi:MAG: peptidylprolyl isomerase, partial [bacterium]
MRHLISIMFIITIAIAGSSGCTGKGSGDGSIDLFPEVKQGEVIAEFDGVKITDKYLESYMEQLNPYIKARYNTPEKKKEFVEKVVQGEVLARYAVKNNLVDNPILLTKIKSNIARHYIQESVKQEIEEALKISEAEMKKHYEETKDEYNKPEKIKASHILLSEKAKADKVYKELMKRKNQADIFKKLAKEHSEDSASARRGGNVGYFARKEKGGRMEKSFADAAFSLEKVGDISKPVKSEKGYHIIKLTGRRDAVEKSFEDVKTTIETKLKRKKRADFFENHIKKIQKKLGYELYEENLDSLDFASDIETKPAPGKNPLQDAVKNKMGKKQDIKK